MANITALLIVLTLAGEPATNALCVSWCDPPSATHSCVEAIAKSVSPQLSMPTTTCGTGLTVAPFLREEGRGAFHPAATAALVPLAGRNGVEEVRRVHLHGDDEATAHRLLPLLVLRV